MHVKVICEEILLKPNKRPKRFKKRDKKYITQNNSRQGWGYYCETTRFPGTEPMQSIVEGWEF